MLFEFLLRIDQLFFFDLQDVLRPLQSEVGLACLLCVDCQSFCCLLRGLDRQLGDALGFVRVELDLDGVLLHLNDLLCLCFFLGFGYSARFQELVLFPLECAQLMVLL